MYTHLVESTCGMFVAYYRDGRWVGRSAKRAAGSWRPKASAKYDTLVPNIIVIQPL